MDRIGPFCSITANAAPVSARRGSDLPVVALLSNGIPLEALTPCVQVVTLGADDLADGTVPARLRRFIVTLFEVDWQLGRGWLEWTGDFGGGYVEVRRGYDGEWRFHSGLRGSGCVQTVISPDPE